MRKKNNKEFIILICANCNYNRVKIIFKKTNSYKLFFILNFKKKIFHKRLLFNKMMKLDNQKIWKK